MPAAALTAGCTILQDQLINFEGNLEASGSAGINVRWYMLCEWECGGGRRRLLT